MWTLDILLKQSFPMAGNQKLDHNIQSLTDLERERERERSPNPLEDLKLDATLVLCEIC